MLSRHRAQRSRAESPQDQNHMNDQTKRDIGYYWVKWNRDNESNPQGWIIAEYCSSGYWYAAGFEDSFPESDFSEIGPRILPPDA